MKTMRNRCFDVVGSRFAALVAVLALSVALLSAVPCTSLAAEAAASDTAATIGETSDSQAIDMSDIFVQDYYGLFSESEWDSLETRAADLSAVCNCGVYLLTVDDIDGMNVRDYAKAYYRQYGVGLGASKSGILFLIAVDSRDYVTITYGDATTIFTDYQIERLEDAIVDEISEDRWVDGATAYLDCAEEAIAFYVENGEPLDSHNAPRNIPLMVIVAIVAGLVIAGLIAGGLTYGPYRAMRTAREATEAFDYVDDDRPLQLTSERDSYRTTTVVAVPLHKNDDDGPGGGGSFIDSGGFGGSSGGKF